MAFPEVESSKFGVPPPAGGADTETSDLFGGLDEGDASADGSAVVEPGTFFFDSLRVPTHSGRVASNSPRSLIHVLERSGDRVVLRERCGRAVREFATSWLESAAGAGPFALAVLPDRMVAASVVSSEANGSLLLEVLDTGNHPAPYDRLRVVFGLTDAEFVTLAAYCVGMPIRSIASVRSRSAETVKRQLKDAMAKLGVTKQEDAVRAFFAIMIPAINKTFFAARRARGLAASRAPNTSDRYSPQPADAVGSVEDARNRRWSRRA